MQTSLPGVSYEGAPARRYAQAARPTLRVRVDVAARDVRFADSLAAKITPGQTRRIEQALAPFAPKARTE